MTAGSGHQSRQDEVLFDVSWTRWIKLPKGSALAVIFIARFAIHPAEGNPPRDQFSAYKAHSRDCSPIASCDSST